MKSVSDTIPALCVAMLFIIALVPGCEHRQNGSLNISRIPNGEQARTERDFNEDKYRFMIRHTVESFKKHAVSHSSNNEAVRFLENVCRTVACPSDKQLYRELAREGARLIEKGCDDPLVRVWYGYMLYRSNQDGLAEPFLMTAYAWGENKYPDIHTFYAFNALSWISSRKSKRLPDEVHIHTGNALNAIGFAVNNKEYTADEIPMAFRLLKRIAGARHDKYDFVAKIIEQRADADKWLLNLLYGCHEFDVAWKARGGGFANEVADEKWKFFKEHMTKARNYLMKAQEAHPGRPELAAIMMAIARTGHGNEGETSRTWFDRAVSYQMDYPDAYKEIVTELRPRWGGSHKAMLAFGQECLFTNRFDTDVPLFYLYVLRKICRDKGMNNWKETFRDPEEIKNLQYLFDNLLKEPSRSKSRNRILAQYAMAKKWSGDYEKARQLLEEAGPDVDLSNGFCGKAITMSNTPREKVEAELRAFTGPHKELLLQAEMLELQEKIDEALLLHKEAMDAYRTDSGIYGYIRDRIAYLRLGKRAEKSYDPPLCIAVRDNSFDIAKFLLDHGASTEDKGMGNWHPLHYAAQRGYVEMARLLLAKGADPNAPNEEWLRPLHLAVLKHRVEMVPLLVEHSADIDAPTCSLWTPLHYALYKGHTDQAQWIIQNGGNIHARNNGGWTPLLYALYNDHADIVRLLIDKGVDVNAKAPAGTTPLMVMTWHGKIKYVKFLLEHGADPTMKKNDGTTALSLARQRNFNNIVDLLTTAKP